MCIMNHCLQRGRRLHHLGLLLGNRQNHNETSIKLFWSENPHVSLSSCCTWNTSCISIFCYVSSKKIEAFTLCSESSWYWNGIYLQYISSQGCILVISRGTINFTRIEIQVASVGKCMWRSSEEEETIEWALVKYWNKEKIFHPSFVHRFKWCELAEFLKIRPIPLL